MKPGVSRRIDRILKALERLDRLANMGLGELYYGDLLPVL